MEITKNNKINLFFFRVVTLFGFMTNKDFSHICSKLSTNCIPFKREGEGGGGGHA